MSNEGGTSTASKSVKWHGSARVRLAIAALAVAAVAPATFAATMTTHALSFGGVQPTGSSWNTVQPTGLSWNVVQPDGSSWN